MLFFKFLSKPRGLCSFSNICKHKYNKLLSMTYQNGFNVLIWRMRMLWSDFCHCMSSFSEVMSRINFFVTCMLTNVIDHNLHPCRALNVVVFYSCMLDILKITKICIHLGAEVISNELKCIATFEQPLNFILKLYFYTYLKCEYKCSLKNKSIIEILWTHSDTF